LQCKRRGGRLMSDLGSVLYTMDGCITCYKTRKYLEKHQIFFTEVNISQEPDKASEVIALLGELNVPVFRYGNITLSKDIINKINSGIIDINGH
jgi:arsenate reductase-like glutaredoxin family protein